MRQMKNSGIEWVGEIPADWNIKRIAAFYCLRNEKVSDRDYPPLSVTKKGIVPQLDTAAKSDDGDNRKLVRKGDFAINSRADRRGSCGISDYDGSVSLINIVLKPRGEASNKYYNWLFHTEQFADEFYKWGNGIVDDLWTTKWQNMKKIIIPVPPLSAQKAIAGFLDKKCGEVDALIADIQQEIETLEQYKRSVITEAVTKGLDPSVPMKDSGIDWVGDIPEQWKISKLKYLFKTVSGNGFNIDLQGEESGDFPFCKASDISIANKYLNKAQNYVTEQVARLNRYNIIPQGSIIFAKIGEAMKKNNRAICRCACCIDNNCQALIPLSVINDIYSYYLLKCVDMQRFDNAGTIPCISIRKLMNSFVVFPSLLEQQAIVAFLDKKCKEIEEIIAEK